jgi:GT2 family glycosyltransferase
LSAAVVNHGQPAEVAALLAACRAAEPEPFAAIEWWVIDNGFPALAPEAVPPEVRIARVPNRGYGAAVNEAFRRSRGRVVLAMNADLLPEPGFLADARAAAERMAAGVPGPWGVAGCLLRDADGAPQGSFGPYPTLWRWLVRQLRPPAWRKYDRGPFDAERDVPWATGACMLINRDCWTALGGFDERFFMYCEDVDFCRRAAARDWRVAFLPRPAARHLRPYHGREVTAALAAMARPALWRYFRKHRPAWEAAALRRVMAWECWWKRRRTGWADVAAALDRAAAEAQAERPG